VALKVLVTGAAGVLGERIVTELNQFGFSVTTCGRAVGPGVDLEWDLRDGVAFDNTVQADVVVHAAAAKPSLAGSEANECCIANVIGTLRLSQWCIAANVRHLVLISGALVYGEWPSARREADVVKPWMAGDYAVSKWASEQVAQLVSPAGCGLTVLRLSSLFGSKYREHLIRRMASQAAITGRIVIEPPFDDAFDLVHVDDVSRTVRHAIERQAAGIWNIGGGRRVTVEMLAEMCARPSAAKVERRPGSCGRSPRTLNWVDDTRARDVLAHENRVSLEAAISETASAL
jgi:UDP-glucose 4-epimerase